jgi:tetratricopeptide (TPR) repeat protein
MVNRPWIRRIAAAVCSLALLHVEVWSATSGWHLPAAAQAWAQAGVNSTLAVLVIPVSRKNADDAEALERLLTDQAARLETLRLFEISPSPAPDANQKAADLVEEGLRALLLRTPKRAQERLAAAAQVLSENPAAGDERLFARLHKGQALAFLAAGDVIKARELVVKSLVLVPNQGAEDYAAYGSTARGLFDSAKEQFAQVPKGDLKVIVKGDKGDVWVDGRWKGGGLVQVEDLAAGTHRVTVRSSGMFAERRFVEVLGGKAAVAEFDLKAAAFASDLDQGRNVLIANFNQPSVVEDRIRELRNQLGADQMLLVRPKFNKKNTELTGYFLGTDGTFKKVASPIDKDEKYLDNLANFLATTSASKLGADLATVPLDQRQSVIVADTEKKGPASDAGYIDPNAPLFEDEKKDEKPITSKWWFWAAVVGGVGLVGGGFAILLGGEEQGPSQATGNLKINLSKVSGN